MKLIYIPLFLLVLLFSECNSASTTSPEISEEEHIHHPSEFPSANASAGPLTEMSLYNLNAQWATQQGDSIELKKLRGKVQIVAMIYTACDYACPRILADLKRIEDSLDENEKKDIGIVLVTLDPERDSPQKLQEHARKNRLDPSRWIAITGEENNVMELAALLNVKYRKELSMDIAHSNIISVLNKEGELIHQQEGLGVDPSETVNSITALLKRM